MEIQHFSHQHPLVFREQESHGNQAASCSGCDEPVIGSAYCCIFCQFCLHKRCAELPSVILNSFHPQHLLTLLAKSPYPNGIYVCDVCKNTRKSFLYHCSDCEFNLDISCASHSKLTSKFDISGGKEIIISAPKEEKIPLGEIGKLEVEKNLKGKAFEAKGSSIIIFRTPFPELELQKPELVSIGPYHRGEKHQLDKYKHSFLEKLLSRTRNNPERDIRFYVREIIALENRARACYSEDLLMSSRDFVKMMLVDGCFAIELLRYFGGSKGELYLFPEDPISIIMPWQIPILVQDLLLLENQIPFFVLEKLFDLSKNHEGKPEASLTTVALRFFDLAFPLSSDIISQFSLVEPNHLLDLSVKTIQYPSNPWNISNLLRPANRGKWDISWELIADTINLITTASNSEETENRQSSTLSTPSASQSQHIGSKFMSKRAKHEEDNQSPIQLENVAALRQAGIEFMASRYNSFLDVNFEDGVIQIPVVTINNLFSSLLLNSMALENCSLYYNRPKPVSSYIYFMSRLIKDANDAKFLYSKGIISRFSTNDKKVADFFNMLRPYAVIDMSNSHLWMTIRAIESYINMQSRKQMVQFPMVILLLVFYASNLLIYNILPPETFWQWYLWC